MVGQVEGGVIVNIVLVVGICFGVGGNVYSVLKVVVINFI